jgi:hypothetical protein
VGGNYTLSRNWGNWDGENVGSGPIVTDVFQYPEYRDISWYAPIGDLSTDQRHRSTMWLNYGVPKVNGLTLSVLEELASGLPYGASGSFSASATVDARPFVTNPGYVTPQGAATELYYYTARDAFRTEASKRTDFAANYNRPFGMGSRKLEAYVQVQVLNVFNTQDLCACGDTVFLNGGAVQANRIGSGVLSPANTASLPRFDPLTTTPVLGTNWNYAANFGTPLSRFAFTSPRTLRIGFGVRF